MKKKNAGLGRGLDAIFLENALGAEETSDQVQKLPLALIDPKSDQPRKTFGKESLETLAASIKEHGVLQPILVRATDRGRYQIIAGERRFRASKLAELEEIPAILLEKDDKAAAQIALIENIQREDLSPIEEALAYRSLIEEYGMTQEELSAKIGRSRSAIANMMRLLDLPDEILSLVADHSLSAGHARTLLGAKSRDDMLLLARRTIDFDLSVRQLEEEVKRANKAREKAAEEAPDEEEEPIVDYFREMELRIQSSLGRKVKIDGRGRKKSITLFYEDNEDLDEIIKTLCGEDFLKDL